MAILTPPPTAPDRSDRSTFSGRVDAFLKWLVALTPQLNSYIASLTTLSVGGANSYAYFFDTSIIDTDPGAGRVRLSNTTQNATTILRISTTSGGGVDLTGFLFVLQGGTSNLKGSVRLQKLNDPSAWMVLDVTSGAGSAGYRNLAVTVRSASSASPFANGDSLALYFDRTGDKGDGGNTPTQQQIRDALGTLPISSGGTGRTSAADALTALGAMPKAGGVFSGAPQLANGVALTTADTGGTARQLIGIGTDNQVTMSVAGGTLLRILNQAFTTTLWQMDNTGETWQLGNHTFENGKGIYLKDPGGAKRLFLSMGGDGGVSYVNAGGAYSRWLNQAFNMELMRLTDGGALTVATSISCPSITQSSDERLKKDFTPLTNDQLDALADISLQGVFTWAENGGKSIGAGAQSIRAIVPEAVHEDENGKLSVNYGGLAVAIQLAHLRRAAIERAEWRARLRALERA